MNNTNLSVGLLVSFGFVLLLLAILVGTICYRLHKRKLRRCKCLLPGGEECGCNPKRIGQLWRLVDPNKGTDNPSEGVKWLALVLTQCRTTGVVHLVKDEQKYFNPVTRWWKRLFERAAFWPDFELLVSAQESLRVAQLLEEIVLTSGQPATMLLVGPKRDTEMTERRKAVLRILDRRRRAREGKPLMPVPALPLRSLADSP